MAIQAGCDSGLRSIDRRTEALLRDTNARLGRETRTPERAWPDPPSMTERTALRKQPDTINPEADSLVFAVAEESRDVAERLRSMQEEDTKSADAMALDLPAALRQAQLTAREFLSAEEDYILSAIRLLIERHRWEPRLFATSTVGVAGGWDDGAPRSTLNIVNELAARKQLPFGGEVAARWVWEAAEDLRRNATGRYVQSSRIAVDGTIPLLRGAGYAAQESLIQAERNLVYAAREFEDFRRNLFVSIASDYFGLLQQLDGIESQEKQLESFEQLEARQKAWYDAGKLPEIDVNLAANNTLNARASLANRRESYVLALDRFKVRLGLPVRQAVAILPFELAIPEPDVTLAAATELALGFRLDLQNQRDRLDDARRQVRIAQNNLLPDLNLGAGVTLPTDDDAREGGVVYELDDLRYNAGITFGLPLDREIERLQLRASMISQQSAERAFARFRDEVVLDVRARVREIERARFNLVLAEQRVDITERRAEEQEIRADEVDTQARVDTANDLLNAEQARDQARTDLRNSVLNYLLATGQLRVSRDGSLEALPGMAP
ncbi:MAG: TolC family protein [Phycisphaeraceae bacterium]|nr:TolC family protein [Phycisphaeraceae bacterium]